MLLSDLSDDIEALFKLIAVLMGIILLFAIIAAIIFGGAITTFFGSMMGAALNRTIAEREYLELADTQADQSTGYHSEQDETKMEPSTARGCSLQIMAALVGGAMLWVMVGFFLERDFEQEEFWACVVASCFAAGVVYYVRQTRRNLLLPAELARKGRIPLYLTWLYICMFFNVVVTGMFSVWALAVTSLLALGVLIHNDRNNASTESATDTTVNFEDHYPES